MEIKRIESLTENEAKDIAIEHLVVKEHDVYLTELPGAFGYSALVFKDGRYIYYANDYALHHPGKTKEDLKVLYIEALNNKLYTEEELSEPIKDYDEYSRKAYYLHNYYGMRYENVSIFFIVTPESEKEHKKAIKGMTYNPVSLSYMADKSAIKHMIELDKILTQRRRECEDSYNYLKSAFKSEMFNHEYAINWQANYDVLSCFGRIEYDPNDDIYGYFKQLSFSDVQKKAYLDARKEYYAYCEEHGMM